MPDGGEVGLDWGQRSRDKKEGGRLDMCADAPILLLLAGLTGMSSHRGHDSLAYYWWLDNGMGYHPHMWFYPHYNSSMFCTQVAVMIHNYVFTAHR